MVAAAIWICIKDDNGRFEQRSYIETYFAQEKGYNARSVF